MSRYIHEREVLTRPDGLPIDYTPNAHRNVRVSRDYWERMLAFRPVGIAPGTESTSDGTPTVHCYNPRTGYNEVRTVSSFAPKRDKHHRKTVTVVQQTEVERFGLTNNIGADYS